MSRLQVSMSWLIIIYNDRHYYYFVSSHQLDGLNIYLMILMIGPSCGWLHNSWVVVECVGWASWKKKIAKELCQNTHTGITTCGCYCLRHTLTIISATDITTHGRAWVISLQTCVPNSCTHQFSSLVPLLSSPVYCPVYSARRATLRSTKREGK